MEIRIKRVETRVSLGNVTAMANIYHVVEDGREFLLVRTSYTHGRKVTFAGEEAILFVDADDLKVHRQAVAPGGACALIIDDEPVEGLSPWALRGVIAADQKDEPGEVLLVTDGSGDGAAAPQVFVDGEARDGFF